MAKVPYLRSVPGGKSDHDVASPLERAMQTRLDELEASFNATLRSLEDRLERALKDAGGEVRETKLEMEIQRALERIEDRLRREIDKLSRERDSDLAEDINRLIAALDPERQRETARKKLAELRLRLSGGDVDAYGKDPVLSRRARPFLDFLFNRYFRCEVSGLEHVPKTGRVLLVANHGGVLPWDALLLSHAVSRRRELRPLIEDEVFQLPFVGVWLNRLGIVRASQENGERMLREERAVAVFPEGIKGIAKPFSKRGTLARFGRGGFARLALRTQCKVVPVAIVGSDEAYPLLGRVTWLGRILGLPFLPLTPTFPWLGAFGLVPLPVKWRMTFGAPIDLSKDAGGVEDLAVVTRISDNVRGRVQRMLDAARAERES